MKKKKLLAFMLACATAAGMISGCGSQSTTAETETASESKTQKRLQILQQQLQKRQAML